MVNYMICNCKQVSRFDVEEALENAIFVTIEKTGEDSRRITVEGGADLVDLSL